MATATSSSEKQRPGSSVQVAINNYLPGACPPEGIDPTVLHCKTDDGCQWTESCPDGNLVCIDGIWYYTWRPKGIRDDYCPNDGDPGVHFHLSCNEEQTGVRIKGQDIIDVLGAINDPEIFGQFCDWLLEGCLATDDFKLWVCDAITGTCFANQAFIDQFTNWFTGTIFTHPQFIEDFITFIDEQIFGDPDFVDSFTSFFENLIATSDEIRDALCEVVTHCIATNEAVKESLLEWLLEYFDHPRLTEKLETLIETVIQNNPPPVPTTEIRDWITDDPSFQTWLKDFVEDCIAQQPTEPNSTDWIEGDPGFNTWLKGVIQDCIDGQEGTDDGSRIVGCNIPHSLCSTAEEYGIVIGEDGFVDLDASGIPESVRSYFAGNLNQINGNWTDSLGRNHWINRIFDWYAANGVTMSSPVLLGTQGNIINAPAHPNVASQLHSFSNFSNDEVGVTYFANSGIWQFRAEEGSSRLQVDISYGFGDFPLNCP